MAKQGTVVEGILDKMRLDGAALILLWGVKCRFAGQSDLVSGA